MRTLNLEGALYRTQLLSAERARAFAACLSANEHFTDVAVVPWSDNVRAFVVYSPKSEARRLELLRGDQESRVRRAQLQRDSYQIVPADAERFWITSPAGALYLVSHQDCDCPDYLHRCLGNNLRCKHIEMTHQAFPLPG